MPRHNMRRVERKDQLARLFSAMGEGEVTVHDIARILDVAPSSYLRSILSDLVTDGMLVCRVVPHRKNVGKVLYSLNPDLKKKKGKKNVP